VGVPADQRHLMHEPHPLFLRPQKQQRCQARMIAEGSLEGFERDHFDFCPSQCAHGFDRHVGGHAGRAHQVARQMNLGDLACAILGADAAAQPAGFQPVKFGRGLPLMAQEAALRNYPQGTGQNIKALQIAPLERGERRESGVTTIGQSGTSPLCLANSREAGVAGI
jgi:hypothetical protein